MNSSSPTLNQYEISDPILLCEHPLVSVLMITYNHEPFLAEAIEGVINQVCDFEFELIIGEDCSPDGTLTVAKEYQKKYPKRIRVITSDENVGFAQNIRRIIEAARGIFSDFCEGDDYWIDNQKLSEEVKLFNSNPDIGIVHGDHTFLYHFWGKKFIVKPEGRYANISDKSSLSGNILSRVLSLTELITHTSTVSYKTSYLKEYIQSEESTFAGAFYDKCVASYCATKCIAAYIDRPVSVYRVWEGSIMRSGTVGILRHNFEIFNYFLLFLGKHSELNQLISQSSLCVHANNLHNRALLNCCNEYSDFLEKYLTQNCLFSKQHKLKKLLYSNWIVSFIYRQFRFWKDLYIKNLYRARIYFNFEERIEIKS